MSYYGYYVDNSNNIYHHGIKGQKWGVRKQKLKRIASNIKTFTKSKHGKRALATGAAIGATSGAVIGAMTAAAKIKQKKDMQRLRNAMPFGYYNEFQHSDLMHHGIKGQKWGIRRYQNADCSLTSEGRKRYKVDMYSHSGNRIYSPMGANAKKKKWSNQANSLQGGSVYNDFQRKLYRGIKKDYRDSLKKGYINKDEYKQGLKTSRKAVKQIAEQRLGTTAKKWGKANKALTIGTNLAIIGSGATMLGIGAANSIKNNKDLNDYAKDKAGSGEWREINSETGKPGKKHVAYKEYRRDFERKVAGKNPKYGYA